MTDVDVSAPEITSDTTRQRYELEEMGFGKAHAMNALRLNDGDFDAVCSL